MHPELERILSPDYLDDLEGRSTDEIRSMRASCQGIETELSYVRRLAQGRLDIVTAEVDRRGTAGEADQASDLAATVEELPRILADRGGERQSGRPPQVMTPANTDGVLSRELDEVVAATELAALADQTPDRLAAIAEALGAFERRVSDERRQLHERLDVLQAELTRRYRSGEATVESLLK